MSVILLQPVPVCVERVCERRGCFEELLDIQLSLHLRPLLGLGASVGD